VKEIKNGILLFVFLSLLTGVLYPVSVTLIAQLMFPLQANGSIVHRADGTPAGSSLVGQPFSGPGYFWSRPSATADFPYNPLASGGSNLGPTNKDFIGQVAGRVRSFQEAGIRGQIHADLAMASGSGLDPHISPESAFMQIPRIAKARGMSEATLHSLVRAHLEDRQFRLLGAPRVNVLLLNSALEQL